MGRKEWLWTACVVVFLAAVLAAAVPAWSATKTWTISSSATPTAGGTITPKGRISVAPGGNQSFNIAVNAAYYLQDVQVDKVSVGIPTTYNFTNVTANHSIKAVFKIRTYTVTSTAGANGKISPAGAKTVNYGKFVQYSATPAKGFKAAIKLDGVVVAKGDVGKAVKYRLENITANHTVEAVFFTGDLLLPLGVTKTGSGGGTITSAPEGINCGATCTGNFAHNSVPVLTAAANASSAFKGWSGSGCSGTGTCSVTMNGNKAVTANFVLRPTLTVTKSGQGTGAVTSSPPGINCGGDCNEIYNPGTLITLTAGADTGSAFAGWSGGGCAGKGTCQVTLNTSTTVNASFSKLESNISITIVGLGQSIKVTNTSPVTIQGLASAGSGINKVNWSNTTTGEKGTCTGTTEWSQVIPLNQGDNKLKFTAYANDGAFVSVNTTLTYDSALSFSTPLTFSQETVYIGGGTNVRATIGLLDTEGVVVTLVTADQDGNVGAEVGPMLDDGVLPDEIQKDGVYTKQASVNPAVEGYLGSRPRASTGGNTFYSETKCLWATNHVTNEQVDKAVNVANSAWDIFWQLMEELGMLNEEAAVQTASDLMDNPACGAAGTNGEGSVWWITTDGILGLLHPFLDGQKGGSQPSTRQPAQTLTMPAEAPPRHEIKTEFYPYEYLMDRSQYIPHYLKWDHAKGWLAAEAKNEMKSTKSIIISPYINNPDDGPNFGNTDDYYGPWKYIKDTKACALQPTSEKLNNGSVAIAFADFKGMGEYGYIHFSTHADNFYNGLLNNWKDEWGPNGWLEGALSQVTVWSGRKLAKKADNKWDLTGIEDDVKEKRIAIAADGTVSLMPSFFATYLDKLPNSLVFLSACRSMYNNSLANVFLGKGAGSVLGYTDYVKSSYAQNTSKKLIEEMLKGKTVLEGHSAAVAAFGADDGDGTPAAFVKAGADNLVLSSGKLQNGDFEDGVLTPWKKVGDGRIITQLGGASPTSGAYMGIISTGLGYTTSSGSIIQDFCATPQIDTMTFNWNYFSEEFKEYCNSVYQDTFAVDVCDIDDTTGASTCSTVLSRTVDSLCSSVSKSDVGFDRGDVYNTGWQDATFDMKSHAGKHVQLKFYAYDVGDSIYDTAILVDNIQITEKAPTP